jgi:hypothetical protein
VIASGPVMLIGSEAALRDSGKGAFGRMLKVCRAVQFIRLQNAIDWPTQRHGIAYE